MIARHCIDWLLMPENCVLRCRDLNLLAGSVFAFLCFGHEDGVNVRQDTAGSDGNATEEFVELLVVSDRELNMTGDDAGLLVVAGSITGELEDLSGEVLHDSSHVDRSTRAYTITVAALLQETMDTADGKLQSSL
jgi:hypothetical protein